MKILIAEDDPVSRKLLERTLEKFGHEVITSCDGEDAWNKYQLENFVFLITDWMMPKLDGIDLTKNIRNFEEKENKILDAKKYCYIIMLTAKSQIDDLVMGMDAGVDDFIAKPFNKKELQVRIKAGERILNLKKELVEANIKLLESDIMKSEFVSIVSHDLGTPMTVMKGFTKMLVDGVMGGLNEKQDRAIKTIYKNIERLDKLRKDILDLVRMDLGNLVLEKSDISINELIKTSMEFLKTLSDEKNQEIIINIEKELDAYCDESKITQVIENYISNAIRYSPNKARIEITGNNENGSIHILVKDNGRGIPKGEEENVFKRFYTIGKKAKGSTGLGLSIVKGIVDAHNGKVWCESEEGKGSVFHFYNTN